ncbi:uncharacterized protein LOC111245129 isoform X2 [Varroa destructor]|uniref:Uncharacterized protein n=1 Tax=Varroa destructor TaxID=109461 RepID=A0A7M7JN90_VARDE|nr:uncharacterized protein LOC111245129 isoform X2 [Varroa destructor]
MLILTYDCLTNTHYLQKLQFLYTSVSDVAEKGTVSGKQRICSCSNFVYVTATLPKMDAFRWRETIREIIFVVSYLSAVSLSSTVAFPVIDEPIFDVLGHKKPDVLFQGGLTSQFYNQQLPGISLPLTTGHTDAALFREQLDLAFNEIPRVSNLENKFGITLPGISKDNATTKKIIANRETWQKKGNVDWNQLLGHLRGPRRQIPSIHRDSSSYTGGLRAGALAKIQPPAINDDEGALLSAHAIITINSND